MVEFENYSEPNYRINDGKSFIIGSSDVMVNLFRYLNLLANKPTTTLLRGETGTGKELFAKALHYNKANSTAERPFVTVNCAGIPSELLESELFGHVRGAFTGAVSSRPGKFEYANGGTIFLDEIGDMSIDLQAKILRVLQEKEITPIGANKTKKVNVRVVAATNRDLEAMLKEGRFREDLYYRLNVVTISIPTLRERQKDIPLIAQYFLQKYNGIYNANITGLSVGAREKLMIYPWKGNVRELENAIERIFVVKTNGLVEENDISLDGRIINLNPANNKPGPFWFEDGVYPITAAALSKLPGAISYESLMNIARAGVVYIDECQNVLFLTKSNALQLFSNETQAFHELNQKINNGAFNQIAWQPFGVYGTQQLCSYGYRFRSSIRKAAANSHPYVVCAGTYAITHDIAPNFVPRGKGRDENLLRLNEDIAKHYVRFKYWTPKIQ